MLASDILFNGDAKNRREALELYQDALMDEWRTQVRLDKELGINPCTQGFYDEAETVRLLLCGCGDVSDELAQRWTTSEDPLIATIGEVCVEGDFSRFAI